VRTSNQFTWALLLNKRVADNRANQFWTQLDDLPWNCVNGANSFPNYDLFDSPTSNSTLLTSSNLQDESLTLSWTNGSGDRRLVVAKEESLIADFPRDGNDYSASAIFGEGADLGDGTFVVYDGTGNSVSLTGLEAATTYHFRVFDYNRSANTGNHEVYKHCGNEALSVETMGAVSANDLARQGELELYPTIATDEVRLRSATSLRRATYRVLSANGQSVREGTMTGTTATLDVSNLVPGAYVLRLYPTSGKTILRKFVKR
ncbi:MAG: T9SS type A sorting domain-containing protein, partial [Bacteroidota bacterium]